MVVYGDPDPANGAQAIVPGIQSSNAMLTVTGGGTGTLTTPTQMTVAMAGFYVDAVFGTWNLTGKPNATFPYMGILTAP